MVSAADLQAGPPTQPVTEKIDFDRDIQPIFALSCMRCHGPEKPRSHFRLDNRASALQGGNENTNDVVPGDSRSSLLLRYVARQVPDMEMPPVGRGDPLTPQQISRLRAWIDQGADWGITNQGPQTDLMVDAMVGGRAVHGNEAKFRELENTRDGAVGGVNDFSLHEQVNPSEKLSLDGRVQVPNQDYQLNLALDETDRGFVHAGFDQWRKYYDSSGGYNALAAPPEYNLNQDLYVDDGRFWVDLGLTPPNRPQVVLGYEYQYRQGSEATLDWGNATSQNLHLYPASQAVDEGTHILKLEVSQNLHGWQWADSARVEFDRENNTGTETSFFSAGGSTFNSLLNSQDSYHDVQGMNTLTLNKQIRDWWRVDGGLYYSKLDGGDLFNQPQNGLGSQAITLQRESEIFSVASLFTPLKHLDLSLASQNEWTRESGWGDGVPDLNLFANVPVWSAEDTFKSSQTAGLHYTRIPFTVLFSEARFQEENDREDQSQDAGGPDEFLRQTDPFNLHRDLRAGFNTSPWRWFSLSVQYHNQSSDTDDHLLADVSEGLPVALTNGYPGFILNRKIAGNGLETKLVLRPSGWMSATLTCNLTGTDYKSNTNPAFDPALLELVTPGGEILDGRTRDQTFGLSSTLTPCRRWYFTSALTFSDTRLSTADNGDSSVEPYQGNTWTLSTTVTCALDLKTELQAGCVFTHADYDQNHEAAVLPYGLDFTRQQLHLGLTRRITKHLSGALHYEFSQYSEPGVAGVNNFTAQGVFASLTWKWR
jgi:hypothetical protein